MQQEIGNVLKKKEKAKQMETFAFLSIQYSLEKKIKKYSMQRLFLNPLSSIKEKKYGP